MQQHAFRSGGSLFSFVFRARVLIRNVHPEEPANKGGKI